MAEPTKQDQNQSKNPQQPNQPAPNPREDALKKNVVPANSPGAPATKQGPQDTKKKK